jgi:ATP-dependent DNA helicase UvrD/PcrA
VPAVPGSLSSGLVRFTVVAEGDDLEYARGHRQETSDQLVDSDAQLKLVVAGPGTGKTFNFRRVLEKAGGGLALTFIRVLADDLEQDLGDLAQVNTFHGFCKHIAHRLGGVNGLTTNFDYYPELLTLVADDLGLLGSSEVRKESLEAAFRMLNDQSLVDAALTVASYYDATSHTDVVYRVQRHLEEQPDDIPTYPVVVVDEYQDFNLLEARLIDTLAERSPIVIAGDDDQALYAFKDASPDFIRNLAVRDGVERFDLPYCSRCTQVVVAGVNALVERAQREGKLVGRIDRQYLCYLPEKAEDSAANPALIHANCTVNMKNAPYIGRYIAEQLAQIPLDDIVASRSGGHPTAIVVGRLHWVEPVYKYLKEHFPNVRLQRSGETSISLDDGYRRIAHNQSSRLGWRIVLHVDPCEGATEIIAAALRDNLELVKQLPVSYRDRHLQAAAALEEQADEPDDALIGEEDDLDGDGPSILCTSLVGTKGLSAEHVFITSFVNGQFPHDPANVDDTEICELIVGLSRTRKACHLISCNRWAGQQFRPSVFLKWIDGVAVKTVNVSKAYWG